MQKIKLIAIDMDGTFLNSDLKVSNENKQAIFEAREKGIEILFATGRPEQLVKEYVDELEIDSHMILYNGSVIGHPFIEEKLLEHHLEKDVVKGIIEYAIEHDIIFMIYTTDAIFSKPNYRTQFFMERNKTLTTRQQGNFVDYTEYYKYEEDHVYKILFIENDIEKRNEIIHFLATYDDLSMTQSQNNYIDINPKGTSKGNALSLYMKLKAYEKDEVMAIGDQGNDVSMLNHVVHSVAMGNAADYVKEITKYITKTNDESGVAAIIQKVLQSKEA